MSKEIPAYVAGHQLLAGKHILITAAAGAGIGIFGCALPARAGAVGKRAHAKYHPPHAITILMSVN